MEIVAITDAPALLVEIEISPAQGANGAWQTTVVDKQHSYAFRTAIPFKGTNLDMTIRYRDAADRTYEEKFAIDSRKLLDPSARPQSDLARIAEALAQMHSRSLMT